MRLRRATGTQVRVALVVTAFVTGRELQSASPAVDESVAADAAEAEQDFSAGDAHAPAGRRHPEADHAGFPDNPGQSGNGSAVSSRLRRQLPPLFRARGTANAKRRWHADLESRWRPTDGRPSETIVERCLSPPRWEHLRQGTPGPGCDGGNGVAEPRVCQLVPKQTPPVRLQWSTPGTTFSRPD